MHPLNAKYASAGTIPPGTDIGHVHLKVSSIDKALEFYWYDEAKAARTGAATATLSASNRITSGSGSCGLATALAAAERSC